MTTLTFDIRPASRRDSAAVAQVHEKSWENAYAGIIPHKSLSNMVSRRGVDWWERTISGSNAVPVAEVGVFTLCGLDGMQLQVQRTFEIHLLLQQ